MADKGYYYLKLKENFFESDELKILESLENGYLYSNILLKLYLKALKNDGKLTFNDYIPYDIKMLATITGHNVDVVEKAIKIFQSMHLIEILDNGTIFMLDMQKMIGSISNEGARKAEYRQRIKQEKENGTRLGQCPDIISISLSNSKSNYLSNDKDKKDNKSKTPTKEEIVEYARSRGRIDLADQFYDYFETGNWIDSKGNKVRNWKQKFITWEKYQSSNNSKLNHNFESRNYTEDEMNNLFDNLDEVKL